MKPLKNTFPEVREIFHGNYVNFEDFKVSEPILRLWEEAVNHAIEPIKENTKNRK